MSIDPSAVGFTTAPCTFTYDWKAVALYALGIGAKKDELDYLYEARGPRVYPSFAVCPAMPAVFACLRRLGGDLRTILHAKQSVRMLGPIPPEGDVTTTATLRGLYDWRKFAEAVVEARTTLAGGQPLFETVWSIFYRGEGSFGGPRPPRDTGEHSAPKDRAPDFRLELATSSEQALLYRLSGDLNPLHADPDVAQKAGFPKGPILHGLCTYGFVARAVILGACAGDASRLVRLDGQFRKPVWPGDTIVVEGYRTDPNHVAVVVTTLGNPDAVMTDTWAEITSEAP
jgi:acyl dehydratase